MKLGLLPILGIVFVVLKLTAVIDWSWWLVLMPFYASVIIMALCLFILAALEDSVTSHRRKPYRS